MNKLILYFIGLFITINASAYEVSGLATNPETGAPLADFDILLTYTDGGIAASTTTGSDGAFILSGVDDGTYELEFYTYPDPIILNGDYFLRTIYENTITVNGENVTGIVFHIPPHHPDYTLTGNLYDAETNELINMHEFQLRLDMQYYVQFFYDNATDSGTYLLEDLPDYTYDLNIFENDYYEGLTTEITIDSTGPDTVQMDFYLQPKSGATVSGVLLDSATGEPIMHAGRTIQLQTINSIYTETNEQGEFTFVNIPPGNYASIRTRSEDTAYVNCNGSEISGFYVPEEGVDNVELYQKEWVSLHEISANHLTFEPGETQTVKFSIENDDLSYGSIWGVNLIMPEGVTVLNRTPFYNINNTDVIFDKLPDCSSDKTKAWEGWHYVGIPPFASSDGNLDELNEAAWAEVTLEFANDTSMENAPIFYEIYYDIHCFSIMPFSYGTIMMENEDTSTGLAELTSNDKKLKAYPNPASNRTEIRLSLDRARTGSIIVYDLSGQEALQTAKQRFKEGFNTIDINTSRLNNGMYFYYFLADDLKMTGKLIISK